MNEPEKKKLVVDAETYFTLQLAKADDTIAAAEVTAAKAQLNVANAKKEKTQTILDFHYNNLKDLQSQQASQTKPNECDLPDDVPKDTSTASPTQAE